MKIVARCLLLCLALIRPSAAETPSEVITVSSVSFSMSDRLLVIAPHPGDEVLSAGGAIEAALASSAPVRVAYLTFGDSDEWTSTIARRRPIMSAAAVRDLGTGRRDEAIAAGRRLGLKDDQLVFLGYPDLGLQRIFTNHWDAESPYLSQMTRVDAVPYPSAHRPNAPYKGEEILRDIEDILRAFKPTKIVVTHPADDSPDHRAAYLFTRAALWEVPEVKAELLPALIHFHRKGWPGPPGYEPDDALDPPASFEGAVAWRTLALTTPWIEAAYAALQAYRSAFSANGRLLSSFIRRNALFGDYFGLDQAALQGKDAEVMRRDAALLAPHPQLKTEERARFVGIESRTIGMEGTDVVQKIRLTGDIPRGAALSVHFIGWRSDIPFGRMPKLQIRIDQHLDRTFNQNTPAPGAGLTVSRKDREITIRCPARGLGYPTKVMTAARIVMGDVPLDATAWRVIEGLPAR